MREAHWGGETHRDMLRRRGVSPVRGGMAVPASSPATACGGAVAQKLFSGRALHAGRGERAREARSGNVREKGTSRGLFIGSADPCTSRINRARSVTPFRIYCALARHLRGNRCSFGNGHIVVYGVATAQEVIAAGIEDTAVEVKYTLVLT